MLGGSGNRRIQRRGVSFRRVTALHLQKIRFLQGYKPNIVIQVFLVFLVEA